jgi:hypothetical protein
MIDEQLKAPLITQYSKDNWSIHKTVFLAYADMIDAAELFSGPAESPEDSKFKLISASNF